MSSQYTDHYFEPRLTHNDGRPISGGRYRTVFDAMGEAEGYSDVHGAVVYIGEPGDDPVEVIIYHPDGSIEEGENVPEGEL